MTDTKVEVPTLLCPIRTHNHVLTLLATITQDGTGATAWTFECPSGLWRFFIVAEVYARDPSVIQSKHIRFARPQRGWLEERGTHLRPVGKICQGCQVELPLTGVCDTCTL